MLESAWAIGSVGTHIFCQMPRETVMNKLNIIWLASYPRSGNTFLRTILWHCFGLRSASIYPNDLGGKKELESYVGHIEHVPGQKIQFQAGGLPLLKTHEPPTDANPAIYVVRDGRAASVSLWQFYGQKIPLEAIITGQNRFGTWSNHLSAWKPWERPNTLLIRYEEIASNLPPVLDKISTFLNRAVLTNKIPDRDIVAATDGRWVKGRSDWQSKISDGQLKLFNETNKDMLQKLGYLIE
jgi:hypothetical protein